MLLHHKCSPWMSALSRASPCSFSLDLPASLWDWSCRFPRRHCGENLTLLSMCPLKHAMSSLKLTAILRTSPRPLGAGNESLGEKARGITKG